MPRAPLSRHHAAKPHVKAGRECLPGPVYLILDNLSVHKANAVQKYVASLNGRLKLFFLPGYSPELNPDEWVWKVRHEREEVALR